MTIVDGEGEVDLVDRPPHRRREVGKPAFDDLVPAGLVRGPRPSRPAWRPPPPTSRGRSRPGPPRPRGGGSREGAQRRQHAVLLPATTRSHHQGTLDQGEDRLDRPLTQDRLCVVEAEGAGERREPPEGALLLGGQQVVGPADGRRQRLVAGRAVAARCGAGRAGPAEALQRAELTTPSRPAASSIASGSPSSARTSRFTAAAVASSTTSSGEAARPLEEEGDRGDSRSTQSSSGSSNGESQKTCSPGTPSRSRLVASTRRPGPSSGIPLTRSETRPPRARSCRAPRCLRPSRAGAAAPPPASPRGRAPRPARPPPTARRHRRYPGEVDPPQGRHLGRRPPGERCLAHPAGTDQGDEALEPEQRAKVGQVTSRPCSAATGGAEAGPSSCSANGTPAPGRFCARHGRLLRPLAVEHLALHLEQHATGSSPSSSARPGGAPRTPPTPPRPPRRAGRP